MPFLFLLMLLHISTASPSRPPSAKKALSQAASLRGVDELGAVRLLEAAVEAGGGPLSAPLALLPALADALAAAKRPAAAAAAAETHAWRLQEREGGSVADLVEAHARAASARRDAGD